MFGKKSDKSDENTIALSQDEVDKILSSSGAASKPAKKPESKTTAAKIKALKEKTKLVGKKLDSAAKKTGSKTAKKTTAQATKASKTAKAASKKPVEKISVYYEGKLYGSAVISKKNGKKIIELLKIK